MLHRKTQVGSIDIVQIRPPRFIGRDGVVRPFSPAKAIGNALLVVSMTHAMYMQIISIVGTSTNKQLGISVCLHYYYIFIEWSVLQGTNEGKYVESDCYIDHVEIFLQTMPHKCYTLID